MEHSFKKSFMFILISLALIISVTGVKPAQAASDSTVSNASRQNGTAHSDRNPPAAPIVIEPPSLTNDTTPTISGTAEEDSLVNVWYIDDLGNPIQICRNVRADDDENDDREDGVGNWSCISSQVLPEREIELVVNATDRAGNTSANTSYFFTIGTTITDTTPPTVSSLVRASQNPTTASSVDYTLTFSEPVTGVDSSDFSLAITGAITGAAIGNITGSGDTYTVTVNTGSGNGTLGLEIPVTATINDLAGNPLGGLPYTSGEVFTVTTVQTFEAETIGVFQSSTAAWALRNSNSSGAPDLSPTYGLSGDYPVVGDWDGNGTDTIGIYRNGVFYLSNSNTASIANIVFPFGLPGDQPVAGDWDQDGIDTIGLYRSSTFTFFLRNSNSSGAPDISFSFGLPGDVGIAGDWNGDGIDTVGVFRSSVATLYLKNTHAGGFADLVINYGLPGDKPVIGDWNTDGVDTIGVFRNGTFYLRNSNTKGFADLVFDFGAPSGMPVAGNWDALP